ncbi:MAG: alanine racemase [Chitinispirillaceae bacterium]|jgi:alanine racemase
MNTTIPYIEISLDNLLHNLAALRSRLPKGVDILAVVKDNAYGCGSRIIAKTLEVEGNVGFFSVSSPREAFFLRKNGIKSPILVLGPATKLELKKGNENNIIFTLNDINDLPVWKSAGVPVRFHSNIDTRMHRLGILPSEVPALVTSLENSDKLYFEGAFTHFANADEPGTKTVDKQLRLFNDALIFLKQHGFTPRHIHYANSASVIRFDLPGCTFVRPGIALYGCKPDPKQDFPLDLLSVASLKSRIVKIKKVPADTPVSYGGRYITHFETFIATIALGYGHGIPRSLGNRGEVLIRGKRYKIAGNITMDYLMIDAGPNPTLAVGDEVVAIGCVGNEHISPDDIALIDNTIGYEILCRLNSSLDRVYILKGTIMSKENGKIF